MKTKILCIPYAGGSAAIYKGWQKYLGETMELVPVELSGRGERINDPLYNSIDEALDDIFPKILPVIHSANYAIFGHSMGAMLTYELAQKIISEDLPKPTHLFFSGRGVPDVKPKKKKEYHMMNDSEFENELLGLGGTPIEIFENSELRKLFLPVLRSDFCLSGTDFSERKVIPFECDISIMVGKDEPLSADRIQGWKRHTHGLCSVHFFNGGHFFVRDEGAAICRLINTTLTEKVSMDSK